MDVKPGQIYFSPVVKKKRMLGLFLDENNEQE